MDDDIGLRIEALALTVEGAGIVPNKGGYLSIKHNGLSAGIHSHVAVFEVKNHRLAFFALRQIKFLFNRGKSQLFFAISVLSCIGKDVTFPVPKNYRQPVT